MTSKTRKNRKGQPTKGWSNLKPSRHQRTVMLKKCGKRCFLGQIKVSLFVVNERVR